MKKYLITAIVLLSMGMGGCSSLGGGGKEGVFVDDFLHKNTTIYSLRLKSQKAKIVPGTENTEQTDFVHDVPLEEPLECSWLKSITYSSAGGTAWGDLRNHKYGGKYHPRPRPNRHWTDPSVLIYPISRKKAESVAEGCGIDFQKWG